MLEVVNHVLLLKRSLSLLSTTSNSGIVVFVSLVSLFLSLTVSLRIDDFLSSLELDLDFTIRSEFSLHPWVSKNLIEGRSVSWVERHHLLEEILELGRVDIFAFFSVFMGLPEDLAAVGCQKAVVRVGWVGATEWWSLSEDNEENNSRSEKINSLSRVGLAQVDFWSHVRSGSKLSLQESRTISSLSWGSETKVCNLKVEVGVKHQVLWLEVTMADAL